MKKGCFPFFIEVEADYSVRIQQTICTVVEVDLPSLYLYDVRTARKLLQLFYIFATQVPFKPNLSKLAKTISVNRNSMPIYLDILEKARLKRLVKAEGKHLATLLKP